MPQASRLEDELTQLMKQLVRKAKAGKGARVVFADYTDTVEKARCEPDLLMLRPGGGGVLASGLGSGGGGAKLGGGDVLLKLKSGSNTKRRPNYIEAAWHFAKAMAVSDGSGGRQKATEWQRAASWSRVTRALNCSLSEGGPGLLGALQPLKKARPEPFGLNTIKDGKQLWRSFCAVE